MHLKLILYSSLYMTTYATLLYDHHHRYGENWSHLDSYSWYSRVQIENISYLNETTFDNESVPPYPFYLKIVNSSIPVLQRNAFKKCPLVKSLFLSDIDINSISLGVFNETQVLNEIDLSKNKLTQIEEGVFNYIENLQYLDLSYNSIENVSERSFTGLQNLKNLYLQGNKISLLSNNVFESQNNSLLKLDMSSNRLTEIPVEFNRLSHLTHLYLQMNNISHVTPDSLKNITSLQYLDLSNNGIQHIQDLGLEKLTNFLLQNNKITYLDSNVFNSQKKSLEMLNISSNSLKEVNSVFHGMIHLTHLYLQVNDISSIAPDSFQNLSSLQHLDLSHNSIRQLAEHVFSESERITHLYLQNNKIKLLNINLFESLRHSLIVLDLSSNTLTEISTSFRGMTNLTNLDLHNNQISRTAANSFQDVNSLEYLDISHNNLEQFQYGLLDHLDHLKYLNFSYNKFEKFPIVFLGYLTNLKELLFEFNKIESLNATEITSHFLLLQKIGTNGNFVWPCAKVATLVRELRVRSVEVLKGNFFTGANVRGMMCYHNDSILGDKDSKSDSPHKHTNYKDIINNNNVSNLKYSDKNIRDLIDIITEKSSNGSTFLTILLIIATATLVVMMSFQIFYFIKLRRNTHVEHLELL